MRLRVSTLAPAAAAAALAVHPVALADDAAMGPAPAPRRVVHDVAYFRDKVQPLLQRHCVECHAAGDRENTSKNRLVPRGADGAWTDEATEANYKNVVRFLDTATPERSTVLAKLTPVPDGGVDHDGGKADDVHLPRDLIDPKGPLAAWIFGATAAASPPVAVAAPLPRTVTLGDEVWLDATMSFDPDGDAVSVTWDVADAPQNARAKVDDPQAKRTRLVPDRAGPWIVRCRPRDGTLGGWPLRLRFAVVPKPDASAPTASAPAGDVDPAARRIVRSLFLDLMGRTPTEGEVATWAALAPDERVDKLLASPDSWRNWFDEESFYFLLIDQFRPVSDRLAAVPERMATGDVSFREAHHEFALSPEFNARNPGNDTYVTVLLEQFLGVEVQQAPRVLAAGKKMYDGALVRFFDQKGDSQSDVVKITLAQPAYVETFLRRMETRYLGEPLPKAEHDAALARLAAEPIAFRDVLREWLLSDRYVGAARAPKTKNDRQFIRSLFVDLLGRAPAYEEFRNMRNALQAIADPKPLRGVLAKVLLDSGAVTPPAAPVEDPEGQVRELFRRLLGRDPERRELVAFADLMRRSAATWRMPALALLTSPHYQYY
jgi:hypothetical protein